jgi:hypothetical protein
MEYISTITGDVFEYDPRDHLTGRALELYVLLEAIKEYDTENVLWLLDPKSNAQHSAIFEFLCKYYVPEYLDLIKRIISEDKTNIQLKIKMACQFECIDVIRYFMEIGANFTVVENGESALQLCNTEYVIKLIEDYEEMSLIKPSS